MKILKHASIQKNTGMHMTTTLIPSRHALAVLAAACLASACASVSLDQRYESPPVRMPGQQPATPSPLPPEPQGVQPLPVTPAQPLPQPLPPIGQTPAQPPVTPEAPLRVDAHLVALTSHLDGASAVPPSRSLGEGRIDGVYDANTRLLRWKASWSGLSGIVTRVQFHGPANSGETAAPTMIWPGPFGPRYEGRATLTPQQAVDLLDGRWYVNVMTNVYPAGEVRGQVRIVR